MTIMQLIPNNTTDRVEIGIGISNRQLKLVVMENDLSK